MRLRPSGLLPVVLLLAAVPARVSTAQSPSLVTTARLASALRPELDSAARALEAQASTARGRAREELLSVARTVRSRLATGDFGPGDRLILRITGDQVRTDSVSVGADGSIRLAGIPAISVTGVLRSEISEHLTREVSRYIRNTVVEATPLLRIGVFGSVANPGFYLVAADAPVTEAFAAAGGGAADANPNGTIVTRAGIQRADRLTLAVATRQSLSFAAIGIESGDILQIGRSAPPTDRNTYLQYVGIAVQLITAYVFLQQVR